MKRSASYNGFTYGLPSKIEDLTIEDRILDPSVFGSELRFQKCKDGAAIRSAGEVESYISSGFQRELDGLEHRPDVHSLTELSDASSGSDGWHEELLQLRRQESVNEKDKARLQEEIKTLQMKLELEEDLRRNDKECMNILRGHISDLEGKLQRNEKKIRELEHEKQRLEVSSAVLPASKPGEVALVKARLEASHATVKALESDLKKIKGERTKLESQQKETKDSLIKLDRQLSSANKELQRREIRINQLVDERRALEDYQRRSRSLQRKDQKSSYALQIQIVNLQEKLEMSEKTNEELINERKSLECRVNKLENAVKELQGSYRSKLLEAIERVNMLKCQVKEESQESGLDNGHSLAHFEFNLTKCNLDCVPLFNNNGLVTLQNAPSGSCFQTSQPFDDGETVPALRSHATALITGLSKQGANKISGVDINCLKDALKAFLAKISNGESKTCQGLKCLEKPLRLGEVAMESPQQEPVWERGPQTVSTISILLTEERRGGRGDG